MSDHPHLVTCVIIFLNAGEFLAEAIDSVLAQTYDHLELVLVDDGSTDTSAAIARSYRDANPGRVTYVQHPDGGNLGKSTSRNLGVKHGTGEFVAFLDADDVWFPDKLAEQVNVLVTHPDVAMVVGRARLWFWPEHPAPETVPPITDIPKRPRYDYVARPPDLLVEMLTQEERCPSTGSVLLRRSAFDAVGGFEDRFTDMFEDLVLYAKLFLAYEVYVSSRVWFKYRKHPASSTSIAREEGRLGSYGAPSESRRRYLEFVEWYVTGRAGVTSDVRRAIARELLPYRHPVRYRFAVATRRTVRRFRRLAGRVVRRLGRS